MTHTNHARMISEFLKGVSNSYERNVRVMFYLLVR